MTKNTQPDTLVLRGALFDGCSFWKPIVLSVSAEPDEAGVGAETAKRAVARDEVAEDGSNAPGALAASIENRNGD